MADRGTGRRARPGGGLQLDENRCRRWQRRSAQPAGEALHGWHWRRAGYQSRRRLVHRRPTRRPDRPRNGGFPRRTYRRGDEAGLAEGQPTALSLTRSEEHTSELQSRENIVCRLLLEKKNL